MGLPLCGADAAKGLPHGLPLCYAPLLRPRPVLCRRPPGDWRRMRLQELVHFRDGALELRVATLRQLRGVIHDGDVRLHAMSLGKPLALGAVFPERRHRYAATVNERGCPRDADQPTPGAFANERADAGPLEVEREGVASRPTPPVDEHHLGAEVRLRRPLPVL